MPRTDPIGDIQLGGRATSRMLSDDPGADQWWSGLIGVPRSRGKPKVASREPARRRAAAPGATGAKRVELSHGYWRRSWDGLKLLVAGVRRGVHAVQLGGRKR